MSELDDASGAVVWLLLSALVVAVGVLVVLIFGGLFLVDLVADLRGGL